MGRVALAVTRTLNFGNYYVPKLPFLQVDPYILSNGIAMLRQANGNLSAKKKVD